MRTSIKLISAVITIAIFITLNVFWLIANPGGESISTDNPLYYVTLVIILGAILGIAIYFYIKSKTKSKIKL